ncbi:glycosyltransferase family 4 protein [Oceanobacillus damuensis]|uniref:glycosyltransferase family 4 protein n=1 Tax=Oceanobacillus damuensis TaxID=937928 RepID=UPI00082C7BE2|nr:MraY family glycosyltransferase [Oceanobacillus damuensis]
MSNFIDLSIAFLVALIASLLLTYPVKTFAIKIGAVDKPNHRKIHTKITPRIGGIAIFLGALLGGLYLNPSHPQLIPILIGAIIIVVTGLLDDLYNLKPIVKLTGQLAAATILVGSGIIIEKITLPLLGAIELGFFSVFITVIWVVGITNAINLIDGLDGLATGVSTIALISIFIIAMIDAESLVAYLSIVLIGANLGFLYHNFYPAKIYMGDAGSNFLGFMVAVISILGLFKNHTLFSFIIPIIVLAVPIFDTLSAMVRRAYNNEGIMTADKKHLHYQLIEHGYSHRKTVLVIYLFSALFGGLAVVFSIIDTNISTSLLITVIVLFILHVFAELAGLVKGGKRPVVGTLRKLKKKLKKKMSRSEKKRS